MGGMPTWFAQGLLTGQREYQPVKNSANLPPMLVLHRHLPSGDMRAPWSMQCSSVQTCPPALDCLLAQRSMPAHHWPRLIPSCWVTADRELGFGPKMMQLSDNKARHTHIIPTSLLTTAETSHMMVHSGSVCSSDYCSNAVLREPCLHACADVLEIALTCIHGVYDLIDVV